MLWGFCDVSGNDMRDEKSFARLKSTSIRNEFYERFYFEILHNARMKLMIAKRETELSFHKRHRNNICASSYCLNKQK